MNWGKGITLVIALFVLTIIAMVFVASKQSNEMLDKDYYQKELKYQKLIDANKNLMTLSNKISINQTSNDIEIIFPMEASKNISESNLEFIKPDNQKFDKNIQITTDENNAMKINKSDFQDGVYKLRMFWKSNQIPYYYEQEIVIKK